MIIKKIHIDSFGVLRNCEYDFSQGLNAVVGENESGKTSLSMFIKFIFYGFAARASGSLVSEKKKYVNWDTGAAAGYMILQNKNGEYRIERTLSVSGVDGARETTRERISIIDLSDNSPVYKGVSPADAFLGVPEDVFVNTVFISQSRGAAFECADVMNALENLIRSGDENVNTEKAYAKLDEARRQLLYKNESGGKIVELKRELAEAQTRLESAKQRAAETIEAELSYSEGEKRREELDAKNSELTAVCAAYDAIYVKRALDASSAAERRTAELKNKIAALEASLQGGIESEKKFTLLEAEYRSRSESARRAGEELAAFDGEKSEIGEVIDEGGLYEKTELYGARMRGFLAAAVCLLFFAFLGGGMAWILYTIHSAYEIAVVASAFFFAVALILLIARSGAKRSLKSIYREWNVESEAELSEAIKEYNRLALEAKDDFEKYRRIKAASDSEGEQLAVLSKKISAFAGEMGVETSASTESNIEKCRELIEKNKSVCSALRREYDSINGRLAILREQIGTPDRELIESEYREAVASPVGAIAEKMDASAIASARRERDFTSSALKSQIVRVAELEKRIAVLRAGAPSPTLESVRVAELSAQLEVLSDRHEAYMLAMKTLTTAAENVRSTLTPRILGRACSLLHSISGGKYKALGLSRNFEMSYTKSGETRSVDYLSGGSRDMAYIALRLALLDVVFGDDPPPAVFDESFMSIDQSRRARLYELLSADDSPQSIVTSLDNSAVPSSASVIRLS